MMNTTKGKTLARRFFSSSNSPTTSPFDPYPRACHNYVSTTSSGRIVRRMVPINLLKMFPSLSMLTNCEPTFSHQRAPNKQKLK
jgi:hypothetical protein